MKIDSVSQVLDFEVQSLKNHYYVVVIFLILDSAKEIAVYCS